MPAALNALFPALAKHVGQSLVQSLKSPVNNIEAAYCFTRNQNIKAETIAEAGYKATVELAQSYDYLLALEDTTSLEFTHRTVWMTFIVVLECLSKISHCHKRIRLRH